MRQRSHWYSYYPKEGYYQKNSVGVPLFQRSIFNCRIISKIYHTYDTWSFCLSTGVVQGVFNISHCFLTFHFFVKVMGIKNLLSIQNQSQYQLVHQNVRKKVVHLAKLILHFEKKWFENYIFEIISLCFLYMVPIVFFNFVIRKLYEGL